MVDDFASLFNCTTLSWLGLIDYSFIVLHVSLSVPESWYLAIKFCCLVHYSPLCVRACVCVYVCVCECVF